MCRPSRDQQVVKGSRHPLLGDQVGVEHRLEEIVSGAIFASDRADHATRQRRQRPLEPATCRGDLPHVLCDLGGLVDPAELQEHPDELVAEATAVLARASVIRRLQELVSRLAAPLGQLELGQCAAEVRREIWQATFDEGLGVLQVVTETCEVAGHYACHGELVDYLEPPVPVLQLLAVDDVERPPGPARRARELTHMQQARGEAVGVARHVVCAALLLGEANAFPQEIDRAFIVGM